MAAKPSLPEHKRAQFAIDARTMTIVQLARKYKLQERTAANWKHKLCPRGAA